jgi:26S proteasome regulatory subunit N9
MKKGIKSLLILRLWYELTEQVLGYTLTLEKEQPGNVLVQFYELFIRDLETRINYLKYARMVVSTSRRFEKRNEANDFLIKIKDRLGISKEAQLLLRIEIIANKLYETTVVELGDQLVQIKEEIEKCPGADSLLYSEVYRVHALYFFKRKQHEEFYQYALQYLAYTPAANIEQAEKIQWSVRMGMAAILGKKIYNIGELVEKEILKSLTATEYVWLYDIMQAFNGARVQEFYKAVEAYKSNIEAHPEIKSNVEHMYVKIRILALLDLIFTRQKEDRNISFELISKISEVKIEEVELLVMKAMSLGLIKGEIDQVESIVKVTWMKPRVLDMQRIQIMKDTIDKWKVKVQANLKDLEDKTRDIAKP